MIFPYSEFFNPLSTHDAQLYELFESPEGVWFMLSLSYQLQTGRVASLLSSYPAARRISACFWAQP